MENSHLAEYMKATDGAVEEFVLHEMTQIAKNAICECCL